MGNIFLGLNTVGLIMLVFLIGIGIYDIYRVASEHKTISQKVHAWFPKWGDAAVLIGVMSGIWWVLGPNYFVTVLWGVILGHFFWNADR